MSARTDALPFVVGLPNGTVVCIPAWLLALLAVLLAGAGALRGWQRLEAD